jgi:hypothetical protein
MALLISSSPCFSRLIFASPLHMSTATALAKRLSQNRIDLNAEQALGLLVRWAALVLGQSKGETTSPPRVFGPLTRGGEDRVCCIIESTTLIGPHKNNSN